MSEIAPALGQVASLVVLLGLSIPILGRHLAATYTSERHLAVERGAYRLLRVDPDADQHWRSYAMSVLGRLFPATGADIGLELLDLRSTPRGVTLQTYRTTGRPEYEAS